MSLLQLSKRADILLHHTSGIMSNTILDFIVMIRNLNYIISSLNHFDFLYSLFTLLAFIGTCLLGISICSEFTQIFDLQFFSGPELLQHELDDAGQDLFQTGKP